MKVKFRTGIAVHFKDFDARNKARHNHVGLIPIPKGIKLRSVNEGVRGKRLDGGVRRRGCRETPPGE